VGDFGDRKAAFRLRSRGPTVPASRIGDQTVSKVSHRRPGRRLRGPDDPPDPFPGLTAAHPERAIASAMSRTPARSRCEGRAHGGLAEVGDRPVGGRLRQAKWADSLPKSGTDGVGRRDRQGIPAEVGDRPTGLRLRQACAPRDPSRALAPGGGGPNGDAGVRVVAGPGLRSWHPSRPWRAPSTTPEAATGAERHHAASALFSPRRREGREDPRRSGPASGRAPLASALELRPRLAVPRRARGLASRVRQPVDARTRAGPDLRATFASFAPSR
jgi:hypothetical protein